MIDSNEEIDLKNYNTVEDFQKFIDDNNIQNPTEFKTKFKSIYNKLKRIKLSSSVIYKNRLIKPVPKFTTLDEFQSYILDNKIESAFNFKTVYWGLYDKLVKLGFSDKVYYYSESNNDLIDNITKLRNKETKKNYNTIEDFQRFIDDNNVQNPTEFKSLNVLLYRKMCKLNFHGIVKYGNGKNWEFEDFQKFINDNNIQNPSEFYKTYPIIYRSAIVKHKRLPNFPSVSELKYKNRILQKRDSEEAKQEIIKKCLELDYEFKNENTWKYENSLTSNIELLCKKHNRVWETSFNSFINGDHLCKECGFKRSKMEIKTLDMLKIIYNEEIITEFRLEGGKSLDIYLPKIKLAIECQGEQHFTPVDYFGGEDNYNAQLERDKVKYNICKDLGITLLYLTDLDIVDRHYVKIIKEKSKNYFDKIYFSIDELKNKILEIIDEYDKTDLN